MGYLQVPVFNISAKHLVSILPRFGMLQIAVISQGGTEVENMLLGLEYFLRLSWKFIQAQRKSHWCVWFSVAGLSLTIVVTK